ncbi:MAG TPA: DUF2332 domain-containing protein, partial [Acidimicrobiales bacterium]|nr:DUF2332 domain-containing protein [Acidimicrobiales bacterium]
MPSSDRGPEQGRPASEIPRPPPGDLVALFQFQSEQCALNDSPLYGELLAHAADDVAAKGPCFDVVKGHERDPYGTALVLRFMGGVHRLALEGDAPDLARHYPSAGGSLDAGDPWPAFVETVASHVDLLRDRLADGVQTNEVGRAAALAPCFLTVAIETGLRLRVLEVGTSAGLNLRWDHFGYDDDGTRWGDPASPLQLQDRWSGNPRPWADAPSHDGLVVDRAGCDPNPIDPTVESGRHKLRSFVWPDQTARFARLDAAIEIARRVPARIDTEA